MLSHSSHSHKWLSSPLPVLWVGLCIDGSHNVTEAARLKSIRNSRICDSKTGHSSKLAIFMRKMLKVLFKSHASENRFRNQLQSPIAWANLNGISPARLRHIFAAVPSRITFRSNHHSYYFVIFYKKEQNVGLHNASSSAKSHAWQHRWQL